MPMKKITITLDEELYNRVKYKCNEQMGMPMSPLIKMFLRAFVSQSGVSFVVGDQDLKKLFNHWIVKKSTEIERRGCAPLPGPRLKDLFQL